MNRIDAFAIQNQISIWISENGWLRQNWKRTKKKMPHSVLGINVLELKCKSKIIHPPKRIKSKQNHQILILATCDSFGFRWRLTNTKQIPTVNKTVVQKNLRKSKISIVYIRQSDHSWTWLYFISISMNRPLSPTTEPNAFTFVSRPTNNLSIISFTFCQAIGNVTINSIVVASIIDWIEIKKKK